MSDSCNSISTLGACIYDQREAASELLGYFSIACWLNAQLPQLIKNYKNKSVEGLSLSFLASWLAGDITNLLGGILTGQLKFQIYLAAYFVTVDLIIFFQYNYYSLFRRPIPVDEEIPVRPLSVQSFNSMLEGVKNSYNTFPTRKNQSHKRIPSIVFAVLLFTFNNIPSYNTSSISSSFSTSPHLSTTRNDESLLDGQFFQYSSESIGRIMAWSCTVLYLTSRMPQIWKNYTRKSVEGLSIFMFIFAALGNLTYSMSIFLNPSLDANPEYLRKEIPYILGSVGTLVFDFTILIQWYVYTYCDEERRHKKRRSKNSSDSMEGGYQQLPLSDENYRSRRSSQISAGGFV